MNFKPVNRHLQVEVIPLPKEEAKSSVLLPEGYNTPSEQYKLCRVIGVSSDCAEHFEENILIAVNAPMIERVKVLGEEVFLILENHVLGIVNE